MVNYDLALESQPHRTALRAHPPHRPDRKYATSGTWWLSETREGDVYRTLLEKLEEARKALGGQVFDVLGKLQFEGKPLKDLLDRSNSLRRTAGSPGPA
jgi:hypothetical protein